MRHLPLLALLACTGPDDAAVDTGESDTDTDTDTDSDTDTDLPAEGWDPADFATVYEVGPDQAYASPCELPWHAMGGDTLVRIHWRASPYACKWVIAVAATEADPFVLTGVPDPQTGALPVITGEDALTPTDLDYWNEDRSVIKIGGASTPSATPAWVYVERLDIRSARPAYAFTDDSGGAGTYRSNAASIHIEAGAHITVYGNAIHDSGNGLFAAGPEDVRIVGNRIWDNGIDGSIYEHNAYTEALGILYEGNHFGPLRAGCPGNNLKDRSAGTVVRYNWIEDGNRQLDFVDSDDGALLADARYAETWVYGNVLVEGEDQGNSQIVHYGGDSGITGNYRQGTLHFFHNTVVSTRSGNTTLLRLSSDGETADVRNNVLFAANLAINNADGTVELRHNWLPTGWSESFSGGSAVDVSGNLAGADPGFVDATSQDFRLEAGAAAIDLGGPLAAGAPVVSMEYEDGATIPRADDGAPDAGAYER